MGDSIKAVSCLNETFEVVREICKLVKKSPQRDTHLSKLRAETSDKKKDCVLFFVPDGLSGVRLWSLSNLKDTEMKARVRGVNLYFGYFLGEMLRILRQTDNLSKTRQRSSVTAAKGNALAQLVIRTSQKDRCESCFQLF